MTRGVNSGNLLYLLRPLTLVKIHFEANSFPRPPSRLLQRKTRCFVSCKERSIIRKNKLLLFGRFAASSFRCLHVLTNRLLFREGDKRNHLNRGVGPSGENGPCRAGICSETKTPVITVRAEPYNSTRPSSRMTQRSSPLRAPPCRAVNGFLPR